MFDSTTRVVEWQTYELRSKSAAWTSRRPGRAMMLAEAAAHGGVCTADDLLPERGKHARRSVMGVEGVTLAVA